MKISILTIEPERFESFLSSHVIKRAGELGVLETELVDIRLFAEKKGLRQIDDPVGLQLHANAGDDRNNDHDGDDDPRQKELFQRFSLVFHIEYAPPECNETTHNMSLETPLCVINENIISYSDNLENESMDPRLNFL